jgi:putative FmdB family regulatory protein
MPIFEFACGQCGRTFEEIMTFAQMEGGQAACPACGSDQVQRNLSSFATGSGGGGGAPVGGCGGGGFT